MPMVRQWALNRIIGTLNVRYFDAEGPHDNPHKYVLRLPGRSVRGISLGSPPVALNFYFQVKNKTLRFRPSQLSV